MCTRSCPRVCCYGEGESASRRGGRGDRGECEYSSKITTLPKYLDYYQISNHLDDELPNAVLKDVLSQALDSWLCGWECDGSANIHTAVTPLRGKALLKHIQAALDTKTASEEYVILYERSLSIVIKRGTEKIARGMSRQWDCRTSSEMLIDELELDMEVYSTIAERRTRGGTDLQKVLCSAKLIRICARASSAGYYSGTDIDRIEAVNGKCRDNCIRVINLCSVNFISTVIRVEIRAGLC
ncbi:hypothetical protein Tco_0554218 [Tanacetum coccineum]